jgi:hypothetical protein
MSMISFFLSFVVTNPFVIILLLATWKVVGFDKKSKAWTRKNNKRKVKEKGKAKDQYKRER